MVQKLLKLLKNRKKGISLNALILVAVLFLGILLRGQEAYSHNFLFLIDQGRDMLAVKNIIFDHHLTLIGPYTSLQGVFQGPGWYYLLSIPTILFNGNPWGGILLMFILSIGTIIIAYFLTKRLFNEKAALFVAFLFATSPEAIAAATYSWNPHPMWLIIVIYIFCFYEVLLKKEKFHLFLWPIIGSMFHFQTALAVFILIATIFYFLIFKRKAFAGKYTLFGLLLGLAFFLPQIIFEVRHDFLMTKSIIKLFSGHDQGLFIKEENRAYLTLIKDHIAAFYVNFQSSFVRDGILKQSPIILGILAFTGIIFAKRKHILSKNEINFALFITRFVILIILLSFLYPFPIRYWFLTGFQVFYLLLFALLISKISSNLEGKFITVLLVIIIVYFSLVKIYNLYINPPNDGGVAKIKGKMAAIDYIYNDAHGKNFNLLVFTPPVNTDAYDYLIWWHGTKKYGFVPNKEKTGTFYLLIEPDSSKPWSYKGWLETVVKTGKVVEEKELPSGFIIQKRIADKDEI